MPSRPSARSVIATMPSVSASSCGSRSVIADRSSSRFTLPKALVGPAARILERYPPWEDSGATALTVRTKQDEAVRIMAKAARLNPAAA